MLRAHLLAGLGATSVAATAPIYGASSSIAVVCPLSGPAQRIGERLSDGVRGAVDAFNRSRGPLERTFAVRTFDDQNTVANAILNAQFATGDTSVIATIGHVSSAATLASIQTYASALMPLIVPLSTDDRITASSFRNVYRLPTKDSFEGAMFARYVLREMTPKLPYVFVQDGDYGADVANGFISAMAEKKIVAPYTQFTYDHPDFAAVVNGALAKSPDYVFLAGTAGDMAPIVRVLRDRGYAGKIGASQGFFDPATTQIGPAAADMLVSSSMPYLALAPATVGWRADYEARYGTLQPISAFGYAAAQIVLTAAQRTNSTTRNQLLSSIGLGGLPVDTMVGTFSFTGTGDALDPQLYFYTVRDGKFAYVRAAHPSAFIIK